MMLNRFIGIGRWSQAIELRYTNSGTPVASSTLAINEKHGDKDNVTFIPVVMWKKLAETVAQYSDKGRLVAVEGRISQRSYENREGQKVRVTEVVADNVRFLDRGDGGAQSQGGSTGDFDDPFAED